MSASIFESRELPHDDPHFGGPPIIETWIDLRSLGDVPDLSFQLSQVDDWIINRYNTGNVTVRFSIGQTTGELHHTGVRTYHYVGPRTNDALAVIFQHERSLRLL